MKTLRLFLFWFALGCLLGMIVWNSAGMLAMFIGAVLVFWLTDFKRRRI